ncbi:MAG: FIST signal transduction protein [Sandaracinaceae bacterium]
MRTIVSTASATGSAADAARALTRSLREGLGGADPALVMFFASTAQPLRELAPALTAAFPSATVLGSSTAGEFTEAGDSKGSVVAVAVAGDFKVVGGIGTSLKEDAEAAVQRALSIIPQKVVGLPERTALVLLDPLAGNGEEATLLAASLFGAPVRLAGGAAGDDLAMERTYVSCGAEVASNAIVAAVIFSRRPLGVGVCHAHQPISEPLEVTRAEGGVIYEVDGRPAWDVWREKTKDAALGAGIDVSTLESNDDIGAFLLRYEAGLANGAEYKIRAPLSRGKDGSLSMACGVPTGARIRITESEPAAQIAAARTAARRAAEALDAPPAGAIVFDCICRNLILNDSFGDAVRGMSEELGGAPLAGFETYGEIALDVGDFSGFHNTTTVVLAFPE